MSEPPSSSAGAPSPAAPPPPPSPPPAGVGGALRSKAAWVSTTYFAEGFPYAIVNNVADVLFVDHGSSKQAVGLTALFHLPWNLKFLVGPVFDEYATKRRWLVGLEVALSIVLFALAFAATLPTVLVAASACFLALGILSAMHDIAIDGLYLEALEKEEQAKYVGLRAPLYRFAMFVASGPLVIAVGVVGWPLAFLACAILMTALLAYHRFFLPRTEIEKKPLLALVRAVASLRFLAVAVALAAVVLFARWFATTEAWSSITSAVAGAAPAAAAALAKLGFAEWLAIGLLAALLVVLAALPTIKRRMDASKSFYAGAFVDFLAQPYAGRILAYVILFRIGESFLMKMKTPFFMGTLQLTKEEYGTINGSIGMVASLLAPALGGWAIAKWGLARTIWPFLLAQNVPNFLYVGMAVAVPSITAATAPFLFGGIEVRHVVITAFLVLEIIGAGLGTAVFMVYIMRCCRPQYRAAHMALLTALMSLSFTFAGVLSGFLAEWMGFAWYFAFTFVVTIPGMLLTLFVPHVVDRDAPPKLGVRAPAAG